MRFSRSLLRAHVSPPPRPPSPKIALLAAQVALPPRPSLSDVIRCVWADPTVTAQCPDLVIRLATLRASVAQQLWLSRGNDPSDIQILAVGSTDHPLHLSAYNAFLRGFYHRSALSLRSYVDSPAFDVGYDLMARGDEAARTATLQLFNDHYAAPPDVVEGFVHSSAVTCGGMRGLKDLADAQVLAAAKAGTFMRFIQPDNSFGTWWNIIEAPATRQLDRRQVVTVATKPENRLHLSADDVDAVYAEHAPHEHECWYVTPVGNPSGTKMPASTLAAVVARIVHHNPRAVIIVDSVYVRTLSRAAAAELLRDVWTLPRAAVDRLVFLESLSKSHGLCRERLGMYFSTNARLFTDLHTAAMAFSAGPGLVKDLQFAAVAASTAQEKRGVEELHLFWRDERRALVRFLLQPTFADLFAAEQPHVHHDLDEPCTLYVLLRARENVKASLVFERTGICGVDTPLRSGHYVRFAVGMLKEPVFSRSRT